MLYIIPISLGLLLGCSVFSITPHLISFSHFSISFVILSILSFFWLKYIRKQNIIYTVVSLVIISAIIGFFWANHKATNILAWELPQSWVQEIVYTEGVVTGIPSASVDFYASKICLVSDVTNHCATPNSIFRLYVSETDPKLKFNPGDKLRLYVKLKRPWGMLNPGGTDSERYLFLAGVRATGTIKQIISQAPDTSFNINKIRQSLTLKMRKQGEPLGEILIALAVGVSDGITIKQWDLLRYTGTSHLVAISGLHISLVAGLIFFIVRLLWRLHPSLPLKYPAQQAGAWGAVLFAWGYALLAGMSISTQRACIMVTIVMLGIIFRLRFDWKIIFCTALAIVLAINPLSVLSAGFWLSYLAVGILCYALLGRLKVTTETRRWKWGRAQWAVFLALMPISLLLFNSTSLVSPIANFIAIPWVSFLITPLVLIGAVLFSLSFDILGSGVLNLAVLLLKPLWIIFEQLYILLPQGMLHWALPQGGAGIICCVFAFLGTVLFLAPRGLPAKNSFGIIFCLPLLFYKPVEGRSGIKPGECIFDLLDVGQGLASVIQTAKHVLIFDVGPTYGAESDAGKRVLVPYLQSQHISYIDKIMISHTDLDHRGGLESVLKYYKVGNILSSEPERLPNYHVNHCIAGMQWVWDGVLFEVLHPGVEPLKNRNDRSCVLKVTAGEKRLLLTGDIEQSAEVSLLKKHGNGIESDILVVPHHGSKTSSHEAFIEAVKPQYALFPTGKYNRYGFPKAEIVQRYQAAGSRMFNNAHTGAIRFYFRDEKPFRPEYYRMKYKRFWHYVEESSQC